MAIKVIAQRRVLKIGKNPGVKKFVVRPDQTSSAAQIERNPCHWVGISYFFCSFVCSLTENV